MFSLNDYISYISWMNVDFFLTGVCDCADQWGWNHLWPNAGGMHHEQYLLSTGTLHLFSLYSSVLVEAAGWAPAGRLLILSQINFQWQITTKKKKMLAAPEFWHCVIRKKKKSTIVQMLVWMIINIIFLLWQCICQILSKYQVLLLMADGRSVYYVL